MDRKRRSSVPRLLIQAGFFALTNGYANGFLKGRIYRGGLKRFCAPGLNCYSCPGALLSCPIGSLQAVLDSGKYKISLYVFGFLVAVGALLGRAVCGFFCPFGLLQDLLYRIPFLKKRKNLPGHGKLIYLKYAVLLFLCILFPMIFVNEAGLGDPWFCKYLCPSGTFFAGLPLLSLAPELRAAAGFRFLWKLGALVLILALSAGFYRPFCKYLCPLGALYGFFNPVSLYGLAIDRERCTGCGACASACGMGIKVWKDPYSFECIRCGDCASACPEQAIDIGMLARKRNGLRRSEV